jgi:glycosyltransferase involved in cell wall biosynthesis
VAFVVPPWYTVPPEGYGGTELVVNLLATELVARGHRATVLGREGSYGDFEVVELAPSSWRAHLGTRDQPGRECLHLLRAYDAIRELRPDVVHDNMALTGLLLGAAIDLPAPVVTTLHSDLTEAEGEFVAAAARRVHLVAISAAQQGQARDARWAGVVYNAVDTSDLAVGTEKDSFLVQIARICPDKGQHLAIEAARRVGRPLVLAGKIAAGFDDYFEEMVRPHLGDRVRWIEDVAGDEKRELLARAEAMVFPLQWPEPFGLAMVEAMASGTPVVAFRNGAAGELVEPGITGFLADSEEELIDALRRTDEIDPLACAERARERFSAATMADGYLAIYEMAVRAHASGSSGPRTIPPAPSPH